MKVINMKKFESGKLKAFFDIETSEGMVIKGFKLVEGSNGLFMSYPSEYSKKVDRYYDRVFLPKELKESLEKQVINEFSTDISICDFPF